MEPGDGAVYLLQALHGRVLRTVSGRLGKHFEGMASASRSLAVHEFGSTEQHRRFRKWRKNLCHLDIAFAWSRHITAPKSQAFHELTELFLTGAIAGGAGLQSPCSGHLLEGSAAPETEVPFQEEGKEELEPNDHGRVKELAACGMEAANEANNSESTEHEEGVRALSVCEGMDNEDYGFESSCHAVKYFDLASGDGCTRDGAVQTELSLDSTAVLTERCLCSNLGRLLWPALPSAKVCEGCCSRLKSTASRAMVTRRRLRKQPKYVVSHLCVHKALKSRTATATS